MQELERELTLLTVNRIGEQYLGMPRPMLLRLRRDGAGQLRLDDSSVSFDERFHLSVATVWQSILQLLPEESAGWSAELMVKGRGGVNGGSIALPLSLELLSVFLDEPRPATVFATGLMYLADGWFSGRLIEQTRLKAEALAAMVKPGEGKVVLAIPFHRHVPLPDPVPGVSYLPLANLAHAACELYPPSAERVSERFRALSSLEHLPFSSAVKDAFRRSKAGYIVLGWTDRELREQEYEIIDEAWGRAVLVYNPGLSGEGIVYRFAGERLLDREHFDNEEQARRLADQLAQGGELVTPARRIVQV